MHVALWPILKNKIHYHLMVWFYVFVYSHLCILHHQRANTHLPFNNFNLVTLFTSSYDGGPHKLQ